MAVETVLLGLLGVVAAWLAIDAGRERHRLRARMARATARTPHPTRGSAPRYGSEERATTAASVAGPASSAEGWRYWPLTVATSEDGSIGPRL
jgi:hypothetical protein